MIQWNVVRSAAHRATGINWLDTGETFDRLVETYRGMVKESATLIRDFTGWQFDAGEDVAVYSREDWVDANLVQFERLFAPIDERIDGDVTKQRVPSFVNGAVSTLFSAQVGLFIGILSRRVLGQYEVALFGAADDRKIYFVEPNLAAAQRSLDVDPWSFRFYIALHETTHAAQFGAHPWLVEYLQEIIRRYLATASDRLLDGIESLDPRSFFAADRQKFVESMMSPEQRDLFRKLQAAMSLIEGYGDYVMQSVAPMRLPDATRIEERFALRRSRRGPIDSLFLRLTGLDLKLAHSLGERFARTIVDRANFATLDRAWQGPDDLPTLDEIHEPARWLERMAAPAR